MVGRPRLLDRLLVVFLFLLGLEPILVYWFAGLPPNAAAAFVLLLLRTVPLLWRRTRPVEVFLVVAAASAARLVIGRAESDVVLAIAVAVYSVSVYGQERDRLVVAGLAVATVVVGAGGLLVNAGEHGPWLALLAPGALGLAGWVVGDYLRGRRRYFAELEARAERLQREAAQARERAAEEERLRIARELHDVVAHQVSLMAIQAGAARVAAGSDERAALASIEVGARETLAELNRLLGVLRRDGAPAARAPQPGLADVEALLQGARDAGPQVQLEVTGTVHQLPAALDLCAYRILQEAITNVLKHSGASRVDVRIHHGPSDLELTVFDDGVGRVDGSAGSGHGLIGMRERVELFGGSLEAGGSELGGFRVRARLPVD
ncbi:MAG TPA: histidine kinase [Terriglobales bacterium]|nr:histidine kinase [Terriglobales bacterium]